jgi:predicted nuclease of predicted toxin-antitoxin system
MKLLLDENLSRRIVPFIQDTYPDSTQVALVGLEKMSDKMIRQYAIDHNYIITTKDADFYEMNLVYGQPPKIIWIKAGNQTKAAIINLLIDNKKIIEHFLLDEDKDCVEII